MTRYRVALTTLARGDLAAIKDKRTQRAVGQKLDELQTEPEKRGKPLRDNLKGLYSVRAAGQRYRVVYRVEREADTVTVLVIGIRKAGDKGDAYAKARKRLGGG